MKKIMLAVWLLTLCIAIGCEQGEAPFTPISSPNVDTNANDEDAPRSDADDEPQEDSSTPDNEEPKPETSPAVVELSVIKKDELPELVGKYKGKVVLIDYWATWCPPCKKHFPHTVELSQKYADQSLAVVSISVDEPDATDAALKFLKESGAVFENRLSEEGASDEVFESFGIVGGVPFYQLYDRTGKLRYRFSAAHEEIENAEAISQIDLRLKELLLEK